MPKMTTIAAFSAMLAIAVPAMAQTAIISNHVMPGQLRVTQIEGAAVFDTENRNIGEVKDIVLDRDGRVSAVVLDVGSFLGMGGKYVAIGMADLKVRVDDHNPNKPHFAVDMTKEQLKSAQAFTLDPKDRNSAGSSTPPPAERDTTAPASR